MPGPCPFGRDPSQRRNANLTVTTEPRGTMLPMTDELAAGWEALNSGRWDDARAILERVTAAEETPEAFEALSWAAWWRDDAGAVFAARERAYALYRRRGDQAGAARMATWLAADELDFNGALSVSSGWLGRARRLLEPLDEGREHGWLAFHEGYIARLRGDDDAAAECAGAPLRRRGVRRGHLLRGRDLRA